MTVSSMQIETIAKWHKYCADTSSVDSCDLFTLLMEDPKLSDDQLNDIFK